MDDEIGVPIGKDDPNTPKDDRAVVLSQQINATAKNLAVQLKDKVVTAKGDPQPIDWINLTEEQKAEALTKIPLPSVAICSSIP